MNSLSLDIWVTFFLNNISFTSFSQKSICGLYHLFYFVFNMSKELEKKKKETKPKNTYTNNLPGLKSRLSSQI